MDKEIVEITHLSFDGDTNLIETKGGGPIRVESQGSDLARLLKILRVKGVIIGIQKRRPENMVCQEVE